MFAYSLLLGAGLTVSSPWWLFRMLTTKRYRHGLQERLGRVPAAIETAVAGRRVIWLHAVSVGEVLAATRLVDELEQLLERRAPGSGWYVVISTTTQTGYTLARDRFGTDRVFRFPLDFAWAVRRWMRVLQPRVVLLMESELWPRLIAECARTGVPLVVANARMSDRSYRRALRVKRLWSPVLRRVRLFLAGSRETAERLAALGVAPVSIRVTGNLKYDVEPRPSQVVPLLRPLVNRHLLVVGGSLLPGEEKMLLDMWPQLQNEVNEAVLLLAPRHPQRFRAVADLVQPPAVLYRASTLLAQAHTDAHPRRLEPGAIVLLDTVGDLAAVYGLAEVAFVGGSLVPSGGHNPLEPARFGVPVLIGPSFENFREIVEDMLEVDGLRVVQNAAELAGALKDMLHHRVEADALGQRGHQVFERNRGATARTVQEVVGLLGLPETPGQVRS